MASSRDNRDAEDGPPWLLELRWRSRSRTDRNNVSGAKVLELLGWMMNAFGSGGDGCSEFPFLFLLFRRRDASSLRGS